MENRTIKEILGRLLIPFVILFLLLGSYYFYIKSNNKNNAENVHTTINNIDVKENELDEVLRIIGVIPKKNRCNSCINYYLSNDNYSVHANDIISYHKDAYYNDLLKDPPNEVFESAECGMGAADCYTISKADAKYFFELYNFEGNIEDYFTVSSNLKEDYIFFYNHALGYCEYDIVHTITSKYINSTDIKITDKQIIKQYTPYTEYIQSTTSKNVIYTFKKNSNGTYYLYQVKVN